MSPALRTEHYDSDRNGSLGEPTWLGTQRRSDTFLQMIRSMPDAIERARCNGIAVVFYERDLPDDPDVRAAALELLELLGVEVLPATEGTAVSA